MMRRTRSPWQRKTRCTELTETPTASAMVGSVQWVASCRGVLVRARISCTLACPRGSATTDLPQQANLSWARLLRGKLTHSGNRAG